MSRTFRALCRRELSSFFLSPRAGALWVVFLVMMGAGFSMWMETMNQRSGTGSFFQAFYGESLLLWLGLLVVPPVISMHLFAEERRSGTLEVLMTAPVKDVDVVLSKFIGAWLFFMVVWLPTALYPYLLNRMAGPSAFIDWGALVTTYIGIFLIGGFFISVGLLTSSLTRDPMLAAMLCFVVLILFFLIGFLPSTALTPWVQGVMRRISGVRHMMDFSRGWVDSRPCVLYASLTGLCLFLSVKVLESRRWRA